MSTDDRQSDAPSVPAPPKDAAAGRPMHKRRWRKRLVLAVATLLVLGALVAAAPTLASTSPGRRVVLSLINARIAGQVEIDDWSLAWGCPQHVHGLRVTDTAGHRLLAADSLVVPAGLWRILRSRDLGDVRIATLELNPHVDRQGRSNFEQAFAPSSDVAHEHRPHTPGPSDWTGWRGRLGIDNLHGLFLDDRVGEPLLFQGRLDADFSDSLAGRIRHDLSARLTAVQRQPATQPDQPIVGVPITGLVRSQGSLGLVHNGRVAPGRFDEQLTFSGTPVEMFNLLPRRWRVVDCHDGLLDGSLHTQPAPDGGVMIDAQFDLANLDATTARGDVRITGTLHVLARGQLPPTAPGPASARLQLTGRDVRVVRGAQAPYVDESELELAVEARASADWRTLALERVRAELPGSGQMLHAVGRLDHSAGRLALDLVGQFRYSGRRLAAWLGHRWPSGLEVDGPTDAQPFQLFMPLADPAQPQLDVRRIIATQSRISADVDWTRLVWRGLEAGRPDAPVPVRLVDARLTVGPGRVAANQGAAALDFSVDLSGEQPWLTTPDHPVSLLQGVQIDHNVSERLLPYFHPVFPDAKRVSGRIDLTLDRVHVPLSRDAIAQSGLAKGQLAVSGFRAEGGLVQQLGGLLGLALTTRRGMTIRQPIDFLDGKFRFHDSRLDMPPTELTFDGWIWVLDPAQAKRRRVDTMQMTVTLRLSQGALEALAVRYLFLGLDLRRALLDVPITIPLRGTPNHPRVDEREFTEALLLRTRPAGLTHGENLLRGLFGKKPSPTSQPATRR